MPLIVDSNLLILSPVLDPCTDIEEASNDVFPLLELDKATGCSCVTTRKPRGPRKRPANLAISLQGVRPIVRSGATPAHINDHQHQPHAHPKDGSLLPIIRPPRRSRGVYGERPRLPTHRPDRYTSAHACEGERFAHLAPLRASRGVLVNQNTTVSLSTMGLERFDMEDQIETEYLNVEEEAELVRQMNAQMKIVDSPTLLCSPLEIKFAVDGVRSALANFRARLGAVVHESGKEVLGAGYVDVAEDVRSASLCAIVAT